MMADMTDHYRAARAHLDRAGRAIEQLHQEHTAPVPNKRAVASLYDDINQALAFSKIHAQLATVQAITDQGISR